MKINKIGIVGCGLMGAGIAQVCAQQGKETIVREVSQEFLDKGLDKIKSSLAKLVDKGTITKDDMEQSLGHLSGTINLNDLGECDLIIEAIVEDATLKKEVFTSLDDMCGMETIFTTNTSSLTVTELAGVTSRPDKFAGMHFFNPVPRMPLVEVVRSLETSEETFSTVFKLAISLGKQPIACKDNSGFVVNLLLVPYLLDAIRAVENGVASISDIDKGMTLGCGHPMGPLTLLDFVGLDTTFHIANIMFDEYREKRYAPPPLLRKMVQSGRLGKKSGSGFYEYSSAEPKPAELNF